MESDRTDFIIVVICIVFLLILVLIGVLLYRFCFRKSPDIWDESKYVQETAFDVDYDNPTEITQNIETVNLPVISVDSNGIEHNEQRIFTVQYNRILNMNEKVPPNTLLNGSLLYNLVDLSEFHGLRIDEDALPEDYTVNINEDEETDSE